MLTGLIKIVFHFSFPWFAFGTSSPRQDFSVLFERGFVRLNTRGNSQQQRALFLGRVAFVVDQHYLNLATFNNVQICLLSHEKQAPGEARWSNCLILFSESSLWFWRP